MLRVCEKLREVDAKSRRLGLVRAETDYLHALLDAMANMDSLVEVEVLKSLGDVNLEKGKLHKDPEKYDRAMVLYRTALLRCEDAEVGESLENRYRYAEKLRLGKGSTDTSYEPHRDDKVKPSLAQLAVVFICLDRRLAVFDNKDSRLLEYTKLMIEGIVNEDGLLETEAIKSLGDVYVKRGTETRDTTCLTKATALYNTALARCDGFQGTAALVHRLLYTARIRQDMEKTGNKRRKGPQQRRQQQQHELQQRLVSHDFPVALPNPAIAADATGQRFLTQSEYIESQMIRHTPDYRLYEDYLIRGDRALADGDLDLAEQKFASALKVIHDPNKPDRCKEADCLCRLGDVYVQRGKTTKEGRKFTQAAALYNATLARRCNTKSKVEANLQETERCFLQYTNVDSEPSPPDLAIRHKKRLAGMRARVKSQLDAIDQQHNPYQYDEDDPVMRKVEAERAEAVKALFKTIAKDRQEFIHELVDECIKVLGPPPCKYAFIGLGSQATELVTPYSDLEFAILLEEGKDTDDTRRYFINLTHYLHLKVINLGETILPAMAIPSLNDFQSQDADKKWFFDSVTPRGFAFDGFMPWASKTPFGRDKTKTKPPVSLIQTPKAMAKFQHFEVSVAEGYHLSDILRRYVFLAGEQALVHEYSQQLKEITTDPLLSRFQSRLSAVQILWDNRDHLATAEPSRQLLNVKKDIYRFPGIAAELLALCCQITLASTWNIIDRLQETRQIEDENATHLKVLTSISAELRLRTYMANGGQKDSLSPLAEMQYKQNIQEVSDTTLKSVFHIPDTKVLFRYYSRAIPLKNCIPNMVNDSFRYQSGRVFNTVIFDTSNECIGRIADKLFLPNKAMRHLEAALQDSGNDAVKRLGILDVLGTFWLYNNDVMKAKRYTEESLLILKSVYGDDTAHEDIAISLDKLGSCWGGLGDEKKAMSYYEQSLMMRKTVFGHNTANLDIATSLHNLGSSWSILGDHKKAINYYEQSLAMWKTVCGDNTAHPDIAGTLATLGSTWRKLGDQKKAISYCEQALTMAKVVYGDNTAHPDIAISLQYLGLIWSELGDQQKAISNSEQSLRMTQMIYGDNMAHPEVATSLDYLGLSWRNLGDEKKAIDYFKQSLAMKKTIYGDNTAHRDIAVSLGHLAVSWMKVGDQTKAVNYYEQELTMKKTLRGPNKAHQDIAKALNNLGLCWSAFDDHKKAIHYYEQCLQMMKDIHGKYTAHLDIALILDNLGVSWSELGDQKKAASYYEQSLKITQAVYGDMTNPNSARLLNLLGSCWSTLSDQKKAISYRQQSLTVLESIYGNRTAHQDIIGAYSDLGLSWSRFGDPEKAIRHYEHSLAMAKALYGDNVAHSELKSDIVTTLNNLGSAWSKRGDQQKAVSYYEQSLTMGRAVYGTTAAHPNIAMSLHNLGLCWSELGDHMKAICYYEKSLEMEKSLYGENTPHPDIALSLHQLGLSWTKLGQQKKAIAYYEQALSMRRTIYRDDPAHPEVAASLYGLGSAWGKRGDQKKAIRYHEEALMLMKTIYGDTTAHPDIVQSLTILGLCWSKLGDEEKAISYFEQSLTMRKTIYGADTAHPDIARSYYTLGLSWCTLGDQKKAIDNFEQSLAMTKIIVGDGSPHSSIAHILLALGVAWDKAGDHQKSIEYKMHGLSMTLETDDSEAFL